MSEVKGKHWTPQTPFVGGQPGDFIFSDERIAPPDETDAASRPKWFAFECPRGRGECMIPIRPQKTGNGSSWDWNGDREAPTFTPSVNCQSHGPGGEKYAGCGWHGMITKGVFIE